MAILASPRKVRKVMDVAEKALWRSMGKEGDKLGAGAVQLAVFHMTMTALEDPNTPFNELTESANNFRLTLPGREPHELPDLQRASFSPELIADVVPCVTAAVVQELKDRGLRNY